MNHNDPNELAWQAFLYVAGEMTEHESAAFEARLADDQSAREAVASAVDLSQAIALVSSEPQIIQYPAQKTSRQLAHWAALAAACFAGALFTFLTVQPGPAPREGASNGLAVLGDSEATRDLVAAWTEIRNERAESVPDLADELLLLDTSDYASDAADADAAFTLPNWLLAAALTEVPPVSAVKPEPN